VTPKNDRLWFLSHLILFVSFPKTKNKTKQRAERKEKKKSPTELLLLGVNLSLLLGSSRASVEDVLVREAVHKAAKGDEDIRKVARHHHEGIGRGGRPTEIRKHDATGGGDDGGRLDHEVVTQPPFGKEHGVDPSRVEGEEIEDVNPDEKLVDGRPLQQGRVTLMTPPVHELDHWARGPRYIVVVGDVLHCHLLGVNEGTDQPGHEKPYL